MNFMNLKLTLWLINRTIEKKKNKEKKLTCNSVDGGFDKTFYYKQNNLNNIYRGSYNWFHGFKIAFMTHKQNHKNKKKE